MAAGAFAASDDLVLWQVQAAAFAGFVAGDQAAYGVSATGGTKLINKMKVNEKFAALFEKAETLVKRFGMAAIFLSRTIFSPLGPYVGYLSGALRLRWVMFTLASIAGAICWTFAYSLLGFYFASRITQIAGLISNAVGVILAGAAAFGLIWYIVSKWRESLAESATENATTENKDN